MAAWLQAWGKEGGLCSKVGCRDGCMDSWLHGCRLGEMREGNAARWVVGMDAWLHGFMAAGLGK